jgi:hypothetical protein
VFEPISPELALVDPDLAARARAALPDPVSFRMATFQAVEPAPRPSASEQAPAREERHRPYPVWARLTAALWLLVLGILIGGAAIPHAQDTPRVVPPAEDTAVCKPVVTPQPTVPSFGTPLNPGP